MSEESVYGNFQDVHFILTAYLLLNNHLFPYLLIDTRCNSKKSHMNVFLDKNNIAKNLILHIIVSLY